MKKIIVFASALALAGGASYAMEEDAMDEEMMMEAPAPSVTLTGSGEMGFENVDDDKDTGIQLIRAYKVAFSSSSTTDGGLMFGAGISIRDDTGETDAHGHDDDNMADSVQGPAVKGSHVYIGAADGSWKLQFGGNDPGIDLAGGIGVADDNFGGEDDESIALSGSIEGASYRITMARPDASGAADGDWSIGASYAINDISVGVGMDSESGLAIGVGTELAGLSTSVYYSQAEAMVADVDAGLMAYDGQESMYSDRYEDFRMAQGTAFANWFDVKDNKELFDVDDDANGPRNARALSHVERMINVNEDGNWYYLTGDQITEILTVMDLVSNVDVPVEIKDDDGKVTNQEAIDLAKQRKAARGAVESAGSNPALNELPDARLLKEKIAKADNVLAGTTEYKGFGAKVSVPAGEGTSFSIAYSSFKADTTPEDSSKTTFRTSDGAEVAAYKGGSVKTTLIELGVSYDLGGGATLGAGIDKKSVESVMISTDMDADGGPARVGTVSTADTTTLSASVAFSF